MKTTKRKLQIIMFFIIIGSFFYFLRGHYLTIKETKQLIIDEIGGRIIDYKDIGHDYFCIQIDSLNSQKIRIHGYSFFEKQNIQIGDSLYKMPNSPMIYFYKRNNEKYKYCCEMELFY